MDSTIITLKVNAEKTTAHQTSNFTAVKGERNKTGVAGRVALLDVFSARVSPAARSNGGGDYAGKPLPQLPRASTTAIITPETSPRSITSLRPSKHRPSSLSLSSTNGCTELPSPELKQRICRTSIDNSVTVARIPADNRQPLPPTPTSPIMGNKPSSINGSPTPDDKSVRSVVHVRRSSKPMSRKSSHNLFKRVDSRSPLPRDVTTSVMSIIHRDNHESDDSMADTIGLNSVATGACFNELDDCDRDFTYPLRTSSKLPSASSVTVTESRAAVPLSASTTIRDPTYTLAGCHEKEVEQTSDVDKAQHDGYHDTNVLSSLSPTIPAPSPLPEDSPHKYGLRDQVDTPEVPEAPENIKLPKARRKSSGLEIFNEAKNLQSASSFLNGLSTSRRRAESAAAVHDSTASNSSWTGVTATNNTISRPSSTRPPSRPTTAYRDGGGRREGHNFKPSGFAYTKPLTLSQVKCYRNHGRLLVSGNKYASVECAVCRIDDVGEHFSCTWCALRMCKFCRKDFGDRGMGALRERIKIAELGRLGPAANSSSESLVDMAMVASDYL